MSVGHLEAYAATDPLYFDSPVRANEPGGERLPALQLPLDWTHGRRGVWEVARPPAAQDRDAGWKIHVAADHTTAKRIDAIVVPFCIEHAVAFKRLASIETVKLMCAKYAPRSSSGKFITIYPRDDRELIWICSQLHAQVGDVPAPRILTDLAWRGGPLSIRYGPFLGTPYVDEQGAAGQLMRAPDGELRPDARRPVFSVPDGAAVPDGFEVADPSGSDADLRRFRDLSALHFSNSGGVYRAWDTELERWVVLKEARPRTGFDRTGRSAQERLRDESATLRRLHDLDGVPRHVADLRIQDHLFVVQEFADGESAYAWSGQRQPLSNYSTATEHELAAYAEEVSGVVESVATILEGMHARGVASDDVHPGNLLVADDGTVTLVDLEASKPAAEERAATFQVAGFGSDRPTAAARDDHAVDMLALWFLLPYTRVLSLDPGQLGRQIAWVRRTYPLSPSLSSRLDTLQAAAPSASPAPDLTVAEVRAGILETATWQREDRLFPGAVEAFTFGHGCLGYGTGGTLWALAATGTSIPDEAVAWLADRLASPSGYHGLYAGDAGTVWCASQLGAAPERVRDAVEKMAGRRPSALNSLGVWGGLAGDGLVLLDLDRAFPDAGFADRALAHAETCRRALHEGRSLPSGYFHGWSGIAHFLLSCFRLTSDTSWLGEAIAALGRDLDSCVDHPRSGVRVALPDGRRIAYFDRGSSGMALVADEILDHADVPAVRELLPGLATACSRTIVGYPALGAGRAGAMAVLARLLPRLAALGESEAHRDASYAIERHREMFVHQLAASPDGHPVVPGEQALRLSTDVLHGAAGVLLAVAQIEQGGAFLPFFTDRDRVVPDGSAVQPGGGEREMRRGGHYAVP